MARSFNLNLWCFSIAQLLFASLFFKFGAAEDPTQIIAKALICFNNPMIYSSCQEQFRLNASGNLDVSRNETDAFCSGPCLAETELVLNCIDGILSNFKFYNNATINDVRMTLVDGCSNTTARGDFNVAEHIQSQSNHGGKVAYPNPMWFGYGLILVSQLIGLV